MSRRGIVTLFALGQRRLSFGGLECRLTGEFDRPTTTE
jgi:hypothetical protein